MLNHSLVPKMKDIGLLSMTHIEYRPGNKSMGVVSGEYHHVTDDQSIQYVLVIKY